MKITSSRTLQDPRDTLAFTEMIEYVAISLEVIAFPHRNPELMSNMTRVENNDGDQWNWQKDTKTARLVQGLFASIQKSEFLMAFVVVWNCLQLLLGMTAKLQKRDLDMISAYNMIEETETQIRDLRACLNREHEVWLKESLTLAEKVGE